MAKETVEAKVTVVRFSLPYRPGMESESGFKEKRTVSVDTKTYPGERVFAAFEFPLDTSIKVDDKVALAYGRKSLQSNHQRMAQMGTYGKKYNIAVAGAGGMSDTVKKIIGNMRGLTDNIAAIQAAMKNQTGGRLFTVEEIMAIDPIMPG